MIRRPRRKPGVRARLSPSFATCTADALAGRVLKRSGAAKKLSNRRVEQREDKRPQLADLRDSGSLEQDADVVLFMFREEYYLLQRLREHPDDAEAVALLDKIKNRREFIIAKQRNDATGVYPVFFDAACNHLSDLDRQ